MFELLVNHSSGQPRFDGVAANNMTPSLPWRWDATRCLNASTMHYNEFAHRVGVLPALETFSTGNVTASLLPMRGRKQTCYREWVSMTVLAEPCVSHSRFFARDAPRSGRDRTACGIASHGRWRTPFAPDALATLSAQPFPTLDRLMSGYRHADAVKRIIRQFQIEKVRVSDQQTALMVVLALSRLPAVSGRLVFDKGGRVRRQSFVRLYIPGNSFLRALLAKFVALMRGMPQHYDRGTHTMVRYVFSTHGDYYLNAVGAAPSDLDAALPIRLEHGADGERVLSEVVYQYVARDALCAAGGSASRSPPPSLAAVSAVAPAASMSGVLTRALQIRDLAAFEPGALRNCSAAFVERLAASLVPGGSLLVQLRAPVMQMPPETEPRVVRRFETDFLAAARDRRPGRGSGELVLLPQPWGATKVDVTGHTQCVIVPHFPEEAATFTTPSLADGCDDRMSTQQLWYFALAAVMRMRNASAVL